MSYSMSARFNSDVTSNNMNAVESFLMMIKVYFYSKAIADLNRVDG